MSDVNDDPRLRQRMRDGRLQQITEHIDRIERELSEVRELVARMRDDDSAPLTVRETQLSRDRSVTSYCWPDRSTIPVQEDSASL
jgi:hypothetical protein